MARSPNTTTAPTGQIPPFGLRMLPELREKIEEAARQSGRSMNAEIVARLEQSFAQPRIEFHQAVESELEKAQVAGDTIALRIELVKSRVERLSTESRLSLLETQLDLPNAKTDADFAAIRKKIQVESAKLKSEQDSALAELAGLEAQKVAVVQRLDAMRALVEERANSLEQTMAAYIARNPKP